MSAKDKWKWFYRVVRSTLFTAIAVVVFLFAALYVLLSIPGVQSEVREIAEKELGAYIGSRIEIGEVSFYPFNEVVVCDVVLYEPGGKNECIKIERAGAGISLWDFLRYGRIVITYAELTGMDASLRQSSPGGPLNIKFLIDAFAPKDRNKPPAKFDLQIHNIVVRKGRCSFDKTWIPLRDDSGPDFNHLTLSQLNADVDMPHLANEDILVDLRRLTFALSSGNSSSIFVVENISGIAQITPENLKIQNFKLLLPSTELNLSDLSIPIGGHRDLEKLIKSGLPRLDVSIRNLLLSDFAWLYPALAPFNMKFDVVASLAGYAGGVNLESLRINTINNSMELEIDDLRAELNKSGFESIGLGRLILEIREDFASRIGGMLPASVPETLRRSIVSYVPVKLGVTGSCNLKHKDADIGVDLSTAYGDLELEGLLTASKSGDALKLDLKSEGMDIGPLLPSSGLGVVALNLESDIVFDPRILAKGGLGGRFNGASEGIGDVFSRVSAMLPAARLKLQVPMASVRGYEYEGLEIDVDKKKDLTLLKIDSDDDNFSFSLSGENRMPGEDLNLNLEGFIDHLHPGAAGLLSPAKDFILSGDFAVNIDGSSLDNMLGRIALNDISFENLSTARRLTLDSFILTATEEEPTERVYTLDSDWISGYVRGDFAPLSGWKSVKNIISCLYGASEKPGENGIVEEESYADFKFEVSRNPAWADYLNSPFRLLYEARISGSYDERSESLSLNIDAPYIQQGKDKLIRGTSVSLQVSDGMGRGRIFSSIPTKKGVLDLELGLTADPREVGLICRFNPGSQGAFYGDLALKGRLEPELNSEGKRICVELLPSSLFLNQAEWKIGEAAITYGDGRIDIGNLMISHGDQFLSIGGTASPVPEDEIIVRLNDINLDYVFETLNIPVAQFGGNATGEAVGRALMSADMEAFTRNLHVKDLSYNSCVLGDGNLKGTFDIKQKRVGIYADINEGKRFAANVDGNIWIGKDSLSFAFDADKVRVGFLQYYMKAFASHVDGRASGKALLYGTFKDVNMKARMMADTVAIKVGYTNVTYSGSDSIIIDPGRIDIRRFRLHDDYGNYGYLSGLLEHDCFHHPEFDFRITQAQNLMLYDTNSSSNERWFGRVFGSGIGRIVGNDDYVRIIADMTTGQGTDFTFVLDDMKEAVNYSFLTFTDKKKRMLEEEGSVVMTDPDEIVRNFNRKVAEEAGKSADFSMDLRVTMQPQATVNLIMDPKSGDKITAHGSGPLNLGYTTMTDELRMYGKYTLTEGTYNFSLQDLILKDFIIKDGSSISFNGDPMDATLNIRGAYRVNANLTDLDQSFATDKDLNRVNVPVDAMLLVTGELEHPDIKFDIELPTLNSEVEQKVRSIISSEDMMNTQMIYLLALNKFYTPDYANKGGSSAGDLTSVASSTLSSQIQNILGHLTDKVTIAPSLRSDKGDFSDLQFDVALSSRLFNNRLLINGNLGYRDPSTSSTTFIGDFDIEYLLNRSGNLRLKAYNHFNDQNYYLKSALTTQGLGIIWRKDFDSILPKKKKRKEKSSK